MCTLTLVACAIGRLVAGLLLQEDSRSHGGESGHSMHHVSLATQVSPAISLLINALIGVFLQNDDPSFRPIYNLMTTTCCQPCAEQGMCQGGMTCLMPFAVFNAVSVVCDLLLPPAAWQLLPDHFSKATNGEKNALGHGFLTVCIVVALLAEAVAAYYGWRCIQMARDGGVTMQGGDWGQEMQQGRPGASNWGGGGPLGGGGGGPGGQSGLMGRYSNLNYGGGGDEEDGQPARPQQNQNFQVFQGQGQRLGGE